jgi:hypothetical protein
VLSWPLVRRALADTPETEADLLGGTRNAFEDRRKAEVWQGIGVIATVAGRIAAVTVTLCAARLGTCPPSPGRRNHWPGGRGHTGCCSPSPRPRLYDWIRLWLRLSIATLGLGLFTLTMVVVI